MTRMVRARGALAQDDRLDAPAGAVAYLTRHLARDTDKTVLNNKEAMLDKELEKFFYALPRRQEPAEDPAPPCLDHLSQNR
jgi:hypothetical protein